MTMASEMEPIDTDLLCDHCGQANLQIVPGGETARMLQCPQCRQFHYWVGDIWCMGWMPDNRKAFAHDKAKSLLAGSTTLLPKVVAQLRAQRARLGLPPEDESDPGDDGGR